MFFIKNEIYVRPHKSHQYFMRARSSSADFATVRKFQCPTRVIAGSLITKAVRKEMVGGECTKANSIKAEIQQRQLIEEGTGLPCVKTNLRINLR